MLHSIQYSLMNHIDTQLTELNEVVWIYDGVSLTGRTKPFLSVEYLAEQNELIAAGRTHYDETYRFQIGLRANSISERERLSEKVKQAIRQPNIPFYDTENYPPILAGFFVADLDEVTPMPSEDTTDETNEHRVYFDVSVQVYRENGNGKNYSQ